MIISTDTIVSNLIGGAITLGVAFVFFWIQERRARQSSERLRRFLENFAANRNNSADITFSGTTVRPGTGELKVEGYAPTVKTVKQSNE